MSNEVDLRKQRKVSADVTIDPAGLATEAKQDSQIALATLLNTYVDGLEALLTTLNAKDFATETTLVQIKGFVDGIEGILTDIELNTTGLNLEATQLLIKTVLDNIKTKTDNLDVLLSTRASEATLIQVRDYLDTVETKLQTIITNTNNLIIGSTESHTTVTASTSSVLLIAANTNRKEVIFYNNSNKQMSLCAFTPAVFGQGIIIPAKQGYVIDKTSLAFYGIWDAGVSGNVVIQEFSI